MLRMDQVHVVRHKVLVEGQSIRRTARQLGVSRHTVRKYLKVSEPLRRESGPRPKPVLEKVAPRLDELLEEWRGRTSAKQRITGSRMHRQLVEEGYQVGITTVREYLREKRRQEAEVFIPLVHRPGEEGQVDFFEVTVDIEGQRYKVWKFVMRLMYSGRDFVWLYERCDQLAFLDAHVRAFAYLSGVPTRIIYDNLSAAVKRKMGLERELTERFQALVSHYLFEPCFARPGEGHDKGGVEGRGKGIRLQHLTPIPQGSHLGEISQAVLAEVETVAATRVDRRGRKVLERFEQEKALLRALPAVAFEARRTVLVSVSSKATVQLEGAQYSLPSHWAGLEATAYVGVEEIRVVCAGGSQILAKQRRGARLIQYKHYLSELAKKPQAVRQVAPELTMELGEPYGKLWTLLNDTHGGRKAGRVLAQILSAIVKHGEAAVTQALQTAMEAGRCDLLALRQRLEPKSSPQTVSVPKPLRTYTIEAGRASDYDWMLQGSHHE